VGESITIDFTLQHRYSAPMNAVQEAARNAVKKHGGNVTVAAKALGINRTVLALLADCRRQSASESTLRKLGLTKEVRALDP
jgi:Fe-S cluster biogenesis protein NfuA